MWAWSMVCIVMCLRKSWVRRYCSRFWLNMESQSLIILLPATAWVPVAILPDSWPWRQGWIFPCPPSLLMCNVAVVWKALPWLRRKLPAVRRTASLQEALKAVAPSPAVAIIPITRITAVIAGIVWPSSCPVSTGKR